MAKTTKFKEEHIEILEMYFELELTNFSKKKKDIYIEIQRRTKKNLNTIISWVSRHLERYKEYRAEILGEKNNAIISSYGGLTKRYEKYIFYRFSGIGREEAKLKAGYSPKTKVANIEKNPKVALSMSILRERLMEDVRLGAMANLNALATIREQGIAGVEIIEYTDSSTPDGHFVEKTARKEKQFLAAVAATKEINSMLGYKMTDELKIQNISTNDESIYVSDEDFK